MMKTVLKRGLILGLIIVAIAFAGGIAALDIPIILGLIALVVILGVASYIAHNHRRNDDDE
jgi:hypothetical protein